MKNRHINIIYIVITILTVIANAAIAAPVTGELYAMRSRQTPDKVRIVFDMSAVPPYSATLIQDLSYLQIDLPNTVNKGVLPQTLFNDSHVLGVRVLEVEPGVQRIYIDLKSAASYNVFTLKNPNRLVIDINRRFEQKVQKEIAPGLTYTYWQRGLGDGPVTAYILDVDLDKGYDIRPALSNGAIQGLEALSAMSEKAKAVAAVNGSYFAPGGQILGLLKIDGEIISTPSFPRSAVGIMPDRKVIIDLVDYKGTVTTPENKTIEISGVNCERGENELVLYNGYFGSTTQTNRFGSEYIVKDGKVAQIESGNSLIPPGAIVLSAHGEAAKMLAGLKIGDAVRVEQTLGPVWDKTVHALGAGPSLVKRGSIYMTTKVEDFGSDVAGGRAPRTALGITKDNHLILAVVDGRQSHSNGLTLLELALFMQELGAVDAMNLDGGGSSEMVIYDKVVNKPSDGHERRIGSALTVLAPKLAN